MWWSVSRRCGYAEEDAGGTMSTLHNSEIDKLGTEDGFRLTDWELSTASLRVGREAAATRVCRELSLEAAAGCVNNVFWDVVL